MVEHTSEFHILKPDMPVRNKVLVCQLLQELDLSQDLFKPCVVVACASLEPSFLMLLHHLPTGTRLQAK